MYPQIFTNISNDYKEMMSNGHKKMKLIYQNDLIDVHRFIIPLFLFTSKQNHLPIRKMKKNGIDVFLVVKMPCLNKLFEHEIKNIPLLNVCLIANFINLSPVMNILAESKEKSDNTIKQISVNSELKYHPMIYLYTRFRTLNLTINQSSNLVYDNVLIPLEKFGLIKDFFVTILSNENIAVRCTNIFTDALIEIEILYLYKNKQTSQESLIYHSRIDATMLNYYIPMKRLGHKLPYGIYYYSFSSDPLEDKFLGGLPGNNFVINLKIKKMKGQVNCYIREYIRQVL